MPSDIPSGGKHAGPLVRHTFTHTHIFTMRDTEFRDDLIEEKPIGIGESRVDLPSGGKHAGPLVNPTSYVPMLILRAQIRAAAARPKLVNN